MANRFTLREIVPDMREIFMQLSQAIANSGIDKLHQEIIKVSASQINGCAYCLHKHSEDAITFDGGPKRLYVLTAWREAKDWFIKEAQLTLKLTEEITPYRRSWTKRPNL